MSNISHWRPPSVPDTSGQQNYLPPTPAYTLEEPQISLRDYYRMLINRWRLLVMITLLVGGLGAYRTFSKTPLYTTGAILKIEPQNPTVLDHHEVANPDAVDNSQYDYYQTQFALLHSRPLAAKVITELKLESNAAFQSPGPGGVDQVLQWFGRRLGSVGMLYSYLFRVAPNPKPEESAVESPEFEFGVHPRLISRYLGFLEVKPVRSTRLVEVEFTTPDPRLSKELANTHATEFILTTLQTRFELTSEAREFLEQKIAGLKAKLGQAEEALQKFRQQHNVISLEGNENLVEQRLIDLNQRLTAARAKRIELESLDRLTNKKDPQYLSLLIQNQQIDRLKADSSTLEVERARLSTTFTPSHPRIVELDEQINRARQRLDREIQNVVTKIHSDYTAALNTEKALEDEAGREHQAALNLKDLGAEYTILKEEIDSNRSLYENVMKRLRETTISKDMAVSNMQVAERAEMPLGPSSPKVVRDLSFAMALGLLLGAGMAVFLEFIDGTVRTPEDIWRSTTYPTLGVVPHLEGLRKLMYAGGFRPMIAAAKGVHNAPAGNGAALSHELAIAGPLLAESYRGIRTSLLLADPENHPQVLLLTSAQPGEGKTVTTLNLAISLAQSGRKVVVIDADLRRGRCHTLLKRKRDPGLGDILVKGTALLTALELADPEKSRQADGMAELGKRATSRFETLVEKHLQTTEVVGLSFLARGIMPFDSTDVLSSDRMQEVITILRQRFDFVLIDSPPAIALSDAAVLSQMSDGTLLVVRGHKTTTDTVRRLMERLEAVHAKVLGVILNGIDLQRADYADYRYFYRSYYSTAQNRAEEHD